MSSSVAILLATIKQLIRLRETLDTPDMNEKKLKKEINRVAADQTVLILLALLGVLLSFLVW